VKQKPLGFCKAMAWIDTLLPLRTKELIAAVNECLAKVVECLL